MTKKPSPIQADSKASSKRDTVVSAAGSVQQVQTGTDTASVQTLRSVFPQYKEVEQVQREISESPQMTATFRLWSPARQKEFLDFCCGNRGIRILYDSYFKYVFDPDTTPENLSRMISVLIGQDVKFVQILPNESRLGADYTLVIMDIIVETEDGSVINVEVQKIGYNFPGERAACYNADLLLRQYQRVRKEFSENDDKPAVHAPDDSEGNNKKKEKFSYRLIRPVYTIVFMDTSTGEFHRFQEDYIHTFTPTSDTGLKLNLLQNYIFVPLDIFRKHLYSLLHSAGDAPLTEKDAWLAFLSSDDPQVILRLLEQFPGIFRPLYDRICAMCRNTKEMMHMFSEELSILDKNTVMMMIEEQREVLEKQEQVISQQEQTISQLQQEIDQLRKALEKARQ